MTPDKHTTPGILFVPDEQVESMRTALADIRSVFSPPPPEVRPLSARPPADDETALAVGPYLFPDHALQPPNPLHNHHVIRHAADLWATPLQDLREALTDLAHATLHVLYDLTRRRIPR